MPNYPGNELVELRITLRRPEWCNYVPRRGDIVTVKEITAMFNFAMMKYAMSKRIPWRTYERWEMTTYPEWVRMAIPWAWPIIRQVCSVDKVFELHVGGQYKKEPIVLPHAEYAEGFRIIHPDLSLT